MGANYTKEQQALFTSFKPRLKEACNNQARFTPVLNQVKSEVRTKKDLHMIVVDMIKLSIKSSDATDKEKFYHLLVVWCHLVLTTPIGCQLPAFDTVHPASDVQTVKDDRHAPLW